MSWSSRAFRLAILASLVVVTGSCGGSAATGDLDKIQVEISQFYVTVTNTSGQPLLEVRPEILPVGRQTSYSTYLPRLESAENRDLAVNTFRNNDGVPFSPRTVKASVVAVTAKDMDGNDVKVEVPWK
ncbi:MAG: hypothetical protein AB1806_09470 [Acidobacteriota bacterium]